MLRIADFVLLAGRLLLAFVFLLAGATKLVDPVGLRKTWRDFGMPRVLTPLAILALPLAELAVAVALVPASLAWYGACGALELLVAFLITIGIAMLRGRKPDCRCFGRLHSAPVGRGTLLRDGALAACAAWLVSRGRLHPQPDLWAWLATLNTDEFRIAVLTGCAAVFVFLRMLHRARPAPPEAPEPVEVEEDEAPEPQPVRRRPMRPQPAPPPELPPSTAQGIGLPVGTPAPAFELPSITGDRRSLASLLAQGSDLLLVFLSPYCDSCRALVPHLARWTRELNGSLNIVLITRGPIAENRAKLKEFDPARILLQRGFEISDAYDSISTPTGVLIGADGHIRSGLAVGRPAIQQLVSSRGTSEAVQPAGKN